MDLKLIVMEKKVFADSREVAEMVGKRHSDLCRDIARYISILTERNFALSDFFIESSYKDSSGKSNKYYLLSKKGCDMVANKMTGEKGVIFTATYVNKFYDMENRLKAQSQDSYQIADPVERALRWAEEAKERQALLLTNRQQQQVIGELKPKADYVDNILRSKSLVTITQIAKDYGMSGQAMNAKLHELGIQYKAGNQWLLYSKYHACSYTSSKTVEIMRKDGSTDVVMNTCWTQKGRLFLYEKLKAAGILPIIERNAELPLAN